MPKFLLIDIKTNLVKLYMGILILLFGGMFIFGVSNLNHERVTQYIELIFTILLVQSVMTTNSYLCLD